MAFVVTNFTQFIDSAGNLNYNLEVIFAPATWGVT